MNQPKKDLYCPLCKEYPNEIRYKYDWAIEEAFWNGGEYEMRDVDYGDCETQCARCHTALKLMEEVNDFNALPKMQGEVGHQEDISTG